MELLVGGWEVTAIYNFQSGTPVVLPTNSAFYRGDASPDANVTKGKNGTWFDTSAFVPYPTKTTCYTTIQQYPAWTGVTSLPGYNYKPASCTSAGPNNGIYNDFTVRNTLYPQTFGDIRQPPVNDWTMGVRKHFRFSERYRFQLRMNAFNALNHARFGSIGTDPNSAYFGKLGGSATLTQANAPRAIELAGKIYF